MDADAKKTALRMLTYGLYVVTAKSGNDAAAGAVTWLSQASFNPPLLMIAVRKDSRLYTIAEQTRALGVSVLGSDQKEIAAAFFRPSSFEQGKLNGYAVSEGKATGAPILDEAPAWVEVRVIGSLPGGDHAVFVAEVVEAGVKQADAKPLVLGNTEWTYGG